MNRSFTRRAALASAAAVLAFTSAGAFAQATIQLIDGNCSDFALGGSPGARTLTCVVSGPPVCTVTGPSAGTIGTPVTLTASCSPAATSWTWTGGHCPGSNATCSDNGSGFSDGQVVPYTVAGTNGSFVGSASPTKNVTWSNTVPAPSGCSITGLPGGTQTSPYSYSLGVSCSGGGAPTQWQWSVGSTATTQTITGSITVSTTFKVIASNGGGPAPQATGAITVSGGGGGGGGGALSCSGFAKTVVIEESWSGGAFVRKYTQDAGGFGGDDALVVHFKTGSLTAPGKQGAITLAEWGSQPSSRHATLSTSPCDFGAGIQPPYSGVGPTNTIQAFYCVGGTALQCGLYPALNMNTDYYFNVTNVAPSSCQSAAACDMFVDFTKPRGL